LLIIKSFALEYEWGSTVQTNMTKNKANILIKKYVDENYPQKVESYNKSLKKLKETKIEKYAKGTFVDGIYMWQDNEDTISKKLNILEYRVYCRDLNLANRRDWRVPTYNELLHLINYTKNNPATDEKIQYIIPKEYWSGSKSLVNKGSNLYVNFKDGTTNLKSVLHEYNIRCVREISNKGGEY